MFWKRKSKNRHVVVNRHYTLVSLPSMIKMLISCEDITSETVTSTLNITIDAEQVEVEKLIRNWLNKREDYRNAQANKLTN